MFTITLETLLHYMAVIKITRIIIGRYYGERGLAVSRDPCPGDRPLALAC